MLLTLHSWNHIHTYFHAYNKAAQAALIGREQNLKNEYKHWQVISGNNIHVTNNFQIIAVETFGIMLKDYIHSFFGQFIHEKENRSQVLILVTQQLSVAVHTIRSIHFHAMKNAQVFQERRIIPATNRVRTGSVNRQNVGVVSLVVVLDVVRVVRLNMKHRDICGGVNWTMYGVEPFCPPLR